MTAKLFNSDTAAWDRFAAAALSAVVDGNESPDQAATAAALLADKLLEERTKRTKAASDYLSGKTE